LVPGYEQLLNFTIYVINLKKLMSATHFGKSVSFLGTHIAKPCEKKPVPQK
jgi:hypothetical protein